MPDSDCNPQASPQSGGEYIPYSIQKFGYVAKLGGGHSILLNQSPNSIFRICNECETTSPTDIELHLPSIETTPSPKSTEMALVQQLSHAPKLLIFDTDEQESDRPSTLKTEFSKIVRLNY